jgi:hypothetical protein
MGPVRPVDDEAKAVSIYALLPKGKTERKEFIEGCIYLTRFSYFAGLPCSKETSYRSSKFQIKMIYVPDIDPLLFFFSFFFFFYKSAS